MSNATENRYSLIKYVFTRSRRVAVHIVHPPVLALSLSFQPRYDNPVLA
jgi:hypothetical protein